MTKGQQFLEDYIKFPLYIMTHPIQGYRQFKEEKKGKTSVGLFYLAMMILASIFEYKYTGPVVAMYDQTKFSSISIIVYTIVPVWVLSVYNWSITTLLDGKGKMKEIFLMGCYSFFPVVFTTFLCVILSNVVTKTKWVFLTCCISLLPFARLSDFHGTGRATRIRYRQNFVDIPVHYRRNHGYHVYRFVNL